MFTTYKIPLIPVPLPTASVSNNVNLAAFPGGATEAYNSYIPSQNGYNIGLPVAGAIGVMIDG